MDIASPDDVESSEPVDGVDLAQLVAGDATSVQQFTVDPGAVVPEHDHEHEQAGLLVEGALVFEVGGEDLRVEAGDAYVVPSNEPHAVRNDGDVPATGVDVFSPPRADPDWEE